MNLDDIYRDGEQCYLKNEAYKNPYNFGSPEFNAFERGWTQALKRTKGNQISHPSISSPIEVPYFSTPDYIKLQSDLYRDRKGKH